MKNILIVQNSIRTTWIFRKILIERLISKGLRVTIIAPNDCEDSRAQLELLGCKTDTVPQTGFIASFFNINYKIIRFYSRHDYHVLCFFLVTLFLCLPSLFCCRGKKIVSIEGLGSLFSKSSMLQRGLRLLLSTNRFLLSVTNESERKLIGNADTYLSKGIGVDTNTFTPTRTKHEREFNLLYVGRLIRDKGIDDIIICFRELVKRRNDVNLTLVGSLYKNNPSSLTETDLECLKNEFGERLSIVGFQSNVSPFYFKSDILVLPSRREGFPVCVMEANACGIPVVCYDVPGCRDAVDESINGSLVPYKDIDQLTSTILTYFDKKKLEKTSNDIRSYALVNFDSIKKADDFIARFKLNDKC